MCALFYFAAQRGLQAPNNTGCACPNDLLMYTCTAVGAGITVWEASAFECTIVLRHNRFNSEGAFGACSNGNIAGRSIGVNNDCHTSQLNVTVDVSFNNNTFFCIHNFGASMDIIGASTLSVVEGL